MVRQLTPRSSLENLKREAKRWLAALRAKDRDAQLRFAAALPDAPANPTLRDVQLALAREHGFDGWTALKAELARRGVAATPLPESRDTAVQALLAAADRGDIERVRAVLDAYPDIVNERAELAGHFGRRTALHFAINCVSEPILALLLERGADPNIRDDGDNAIPLHFAVEKGHEGIVRRLIEYGSDPIGAGDMHELEIIGWATVFGRGPRRRAIAEYLLAHGGRHNISSAVAMGATDTIREIVQRSPAEVNRPMDQTNRRRRPLHLAVLEHQAAALATLLALGADTEAEDAAGLTALDQAALAGEREMAKTLLEHGATLRIPAAVALGRQDDVERLLRQNPDCLRPGGRWDRLIIRASERATGDVIEALIRGGASVHVRDDHRTAVDSTHGYTALHAAAFNGNADAVRALLKHGANPLDREDKYWGTPAGWANYAGHTELRDIILDAPAIDVFDAIAFDRLDRLTQVLDRDPEVLERPFGARVTGDRKPKPWLDPAWTPLAYAAANGKTEAARLLLERGASPNARDSAGRAVAGIAEASGHPEIATLVQEASARSRLEPSVRASETRETLESRFLRLACLDWRVGGSERAFRTNDAGRLLVRHPELARASIHSAVACGELETVRRILEAHPGAASTPGGPHGWPPLLYLCAARLPIARAAENAPEIARLLLDHGADPNAFYLGGNADIHYTAFTCVMGRGEEQAPTHPRARDLVKLLLERGADPHDNQVLYNVFANHASLRFLDDDMVWLLDLMYEHSVRRGYAAQWEDPTWPMFAMRSAPSLGDDRTLHHGAHFMLSMAIRRNLRGLAEWMLTHGAGPNTSWGDDPRGREHETLHELALSLGHQEMAALLVRYGATPSPTPRSGYESFVDACLRLDRRQVEALVRANPEYLQRHEALFRAVEDDRADVVRMLLDLGMSPDVEDAQGGGRRALHVAAYVGAERCATLLIERGANVDARETVHDAIPLGVATWGNQPRMVEVLGRHSRDVWELTYAGRVERLRQVLGEQPELAKVVNDARQTPLMWLPDDEAAALEAARLLLEYGADPSIRSEQGLTASDIARRRGLDAVADLLALSRGPSRGQTP